MELTRRCDYAFRILRCAYNHKDEFVSITTVSEEEDIPYAFARTIQHDLSLAGFLKTLRGARGGLALAIDPAEITVLDLLKALQGPITVSQCASDSSFCPKHGSCNFHALWVAADKTLATLFGSVTLKDVLDGDPSGAFLHEANLAAETVMQKSLAELAGGVKVGAACSCN